MNPDRPAKSIGAEETFEKDISDRKRLEHHLLLLVDLADHILQLGLDDRQIADRVALGDSGDQGVRRQAGRVQREDGSVIGGLYATSNSAANAFGAFYPGPGAPLGTAMVFGSLAVDDMLSA